MARGYTCRSPGALRAAGATVAGTAGATVAAMATVSDNAHRLIARRVGDRVARRL